MEKILILHAKAEAGKDTCAQIMKEQYEAAGKRVIVIAFADLVRFLLTKYYGITEFKTPLTMLYRCDKQAENQDRQESSVHQSCAL